MLCIVRSPEKLRPYCYVEAESEEEALALAGTPEPGNHEPLAAELLRPELGETEGIEADGEWHVL